MSPSSGGAAERTDSCCQLCVTAQRAQCFCILLLTTLPTLHDPPPSGSWTPWGSYMAGGVIQGWVSNRHKIRICQGCDGTSSEGTGDAAHPTNHPIRAYVRDRLLSHWPPHSSHGIPAIPAAPLPQGDRRPTWDVGSERAIVHRCVETVSAVDSS